MLAKIFLQTLSKCQNVEVTGLKAFKKCPIFWSDLVEMSDVRPNREGVVTGLEREYITLLRGREQMLV